MVSLEPQCVFQKRACGDSSLLVFASARFSRVLAKGTRETSVFCPRGQDFAKGTRNKGGVSKSKIVLHFSDARSGKRARVSAPVVTQER